MPSYSISDQTGSLQRLTHTEDKSEGKTPELKVTLRILLFFKRSIRRNRHRGPGAVTRRGMKRAGKKKQSRFSGGFWEEATSVRTISTHVRTTILRRVLMCLLEIITHIQTGRGLRVCILACVADPEWGSKRNVQALWLRAGAWRVLSAEISLASFWEEKCLCWQERLSGVQRKKRHDGEAHEGAQE